MSSPSILSNRKEAKRYAYKVAAETLRTLAVNIHTEADALKDPEQQMSGQRLAWALQEIGNALSAKVKPPVK